MLFTDTKILLPVALFVLTLTIGLWLSRSGRPLNILVFTIHKLVALGGVILAGIALYNWLKTIEVQPATIIAVVLLVICVLALFVSGAFLSRDKPVDKKLLTVHEISPIVITVLTVFIIYLMAG